MLSKQDVPPKLWYLSTKLHGVTYQNTEILMFITLITLNLTMGKGFCVRYSKVTAFGSWQVLLLNVFVILWVVSFIP
jgi:hypothetical protein